MDPHMHKELIGVDTEAAEQIFHIANRWQIVVEYCFRAPGFVLAAFRP